jgi:hypothetical protein
VVAVATRFKQSAAGNVEVSVNEVKTVSSTATVGEEFKTAELERAVAAMEVTETQRDCRHFQNLNHDLTPLFK